MPRVCAKYTADSVSGPSRVMFRKYLVNILSLAPKQTETGPRSLGSHVLVLVYRTSCLYFALIQNRFHVLLKQNL